MDTQNLAEAAQQMSMWDMVWSSDTVTKAVMIGLIAASVWSWAIIIEKIGTLRQVKQRSRSFESKFWSGGSLDRLYDLRGVSLQQRIEKAMTVSMDKELDELDTRMGFLASTGSVAPLVGLFGTVWGIINSFNAIAATQSNSLSAIAPGIAEALFTTAFGLIAAIPAVVAYNKISSDIDRYANRLENFMAEFSSILSREIDDTAIKADMAGE